MSRKYDALVMIGDIAVAYLPTAEMRWRHGPQDDDGIMPRALQQRWTATLTSTGGHTTYRSEWRDIPSVTLSIGDDDRMEPGEALALKMLQQEGNGR